MTARASVKPVVSHDLGGGSADQVASALVDFEGHDLPASDIDSVA